MNRLFLLSVCALFAVLCLNQGVYPFLYTAALCSAGMLGWAWYALGRPSLPYAVWLPVLFIAYVALTPGYFFKDLPVATMMIAAYSVGLGMAVFCPQQVWKVVLSLMAGLVATLLFFVVMGFPAELTWGGRLCLFFEHPSLLASVAAWTILYGLANRRQFRGGYRLVLYACWLACFGMVAFSAARGTYLALLLSLAFLSVTALKKHMYKLIVLGGIALVCFVLLLPPQQQARLLSAVSNPLEDNTFVSRLPIWEIASEGFESSPLLGRGFRSFLEFHKRYLQEHKQELEARYPIVEGKMGNTHSLYFGLIYAYGVLGAILFAGVVLVAMRLAWKAQDYFFISVVIFYLGFGLFDYSLHRKDGVLLLFVPLGLVYGRHFAETVQRVSGKSLQTVFPSHQASAVERANTSGAVMALQPDLS